MTTKTHQPHLTVKVLGPGCSKCDLLEKHVQEVLAELNQLHPGLVGKVEKVDDLEELMAYGLMSSPGLLINEKLVSAGRVVSKKKLLRWLQEALE